MKLDLLTSLQIKCHIKLDKEHNIFLKHLLRKLKKKNPTGLSKIREEFCIFYSTWMISSTIDRYNNLDFI